MDPDKFCIIGKVQHLEGKNLSEKVKLHKKHRAAERAAFLSHPQPLTPISGMRGWECGGVVLPILSRLPLQPCPPFPSS